MKFSFSLLIRWRCFKAFFFKKKKKKKKKKIKWGNFVFYYTDIHQILNLIAQ